MKFVSKSGLTIIELTIAIALIAIIASLVLANTSFMNRFMVRAEVEKLASACRYLRQLAMTTNTQQKLVFDLQNNSYSTTSVRPEDLRDNGYKLSSCVRFGTGNRLILGPPSAPTKQIVEPITYPKHEIVFYPDGIISSGLVYMSDTSGKYVYAMSTPVSGISFLRTYVYDGAWKIVK